MEDSVSYAAYDEEEQDEVGIAGLIIVLIIFAFLALGRAITWPLRLFRNH